jgi:hypothetical protein
MKKNILCLVTSIFLLSSCFQPDKNISDPEDRESAISFLKDFQNKQIKNQYDSLAIYFDNPYSNTETKKNLFKILNKADKLSGKAIAFKNNITTQSFTINLGFFRFKKYIIEFDCEREKGQSPEIFTFMKIGENL